MSIQVLDSSPNAALSLELIKQQEATKAAEHRKSQAEYEAYIKQMEVKLAVDCDVDEIYLRCACWE